MLYLKGRRAQKQWTVQIWIEMKSFKLPMSIAHAIEKCTE
ncbi:unnamed protein product [Amoebophrya sp. A120]|nr:unnamed protein product [Amoebophrya sp. A120]|eukprot:GSA120T00025985001.1